MLEVPKVYSLAGKYMHKLEPRAGAFQMGLEIGAGVIRSCGNHPDGPSLEGTASEKDPASPSPSWLLLLPQQQVNLCPHAFFSLTKADAHCLAAQHRAGKLPKRHMGPAF